MRQALVDFLRWIGLKRLGDWIAPASKGGGGGGANRMRVRSDGTNWKVG